MAAEGTDMNRCVDCDYIRLSSLGSHTKLTFYIFLERKYVLEVNS